MHIAVQAMKMAVATYLGEVDLVSIQLTHDCHIAWWAIGFAERSFSRD